MEEKALDFIYQLRNMGLYLWREKNKIKYAQYKKIDNQEEILNKIKLYKIPILQLLDINNCHTHKDALNRRIYRGLNQKYPLSMLQEGLYFFEKYEEGSYVYNINFTFRLLKNLDLRALKSRYK